jgi:putative hydrolase of the HAD superfamily
MITTIFFDVGGTLIHPDMMRLAAPLVAHVRPGEAHLAAAERAAKHAYKPGAPAGAAGELAAAPAAGRDGQIQDHPAAGGGHAGPVNRSYWRIYFEALLDALGCGQELLPELTSRAGNSDYWSLADPAAGPALENLQGRYGLGVISNADGHIDRVLRRAGLFGFFAAIADSGSLGFEKPDPRIFHAALQQMHARPEQSLYVGDVYAVDYEGARNAGMPAVLVDPNGVYRGWNVERIASLHELPQWVGNK